MQKLTYIVISKLLLILFAFHPAPCYAEKNVALNNGEASPNETVEIRNIRSAAIFGSAKAQTQLALLYLQGEGVEKNYAQARSWLEIAAKKGFAIAQNQLAALYFHELGVKRDYAIIAKWDTLAAEQGIAISQQNLGFLYSNGLGVDKNLTTAATWYEKAAAQGLASSQTTTGINYLNGIGKPPIWGMLKHNLILALNI